MKYINLTQGRQVIVDDEDFDFLSRWKWQYNRKTGYTTRGNWVKNESGKWVQPKLYLHKEILSKKGYLTDHINGNKLDCRKDNLRIATRAQNNHNARTRKDNKLGYKGVVWREKSRDFVAYINVNGKRICLKTYHNLEDAVKARKEAEVKYHGEFAYKGDSHFII